jgi:nucleoside triphosphatase
MAEQQYPEPTVGAMIFDPAGRLVLMKSHKWKGKYCIPGGHIELGERMVDAVKREVKEETNLDIRDLEFVCFQEAIYDEQFWEPSHFIFFDFACRTDSRDVTLSEEAEEYTWVTLDEALKLPVEHYTLVALREYLKKSRPAGEENRPVAGGDPRQTQREDRQNRGTRR